MIAERPVTLGLYPDQPIKARIVSLTPALATEKLMGGWWREDCLDAKGLGQEIDRQWDWNKTDVDYEGRILEVEKVAVVTGTGSDLAVQGAMIVSTEPIDSVDEPGEQCLLVELL